MVITWKTWNEGRQRCVRRNISHWFLWEIVQYTCSKLTTWIKEHTWKKVKSYDIKIKILDGFMFKTLNASFNRSRVVVSTLFTLFVVVLFEFWQCLERWPQDGFLTRAVVYRSVFHIYVITCNQSNTIVSYIHQNIICKQLYERWVMWTMEQEITTYLKYK